MNGVQHLLFWQIDENVAIGVRIAEPEYLYGPGFAMNNQAAVECQCWQGHLHALEFGQIGLGLA
jgi:hypothetical protein